MSEKINFITQSYMWKYPRTQGDKNVYAVTEFYYNHKKTELKAFKFIKIGKRKEQHIKDKKLYDSDIYILSIPEEQMEVEQWTTESGKTYNVLSFGDDVTFDKLTERNGEIYFIYNSCNHSYYSNELTFEGIGGIEKRGEKWVFPIIKKIIISFSNPEEAKNKWEVFDGKRFCAVEGINWERAIMSSKSLEIKVFSRVGELTEAGETNTPIPEITAGTHTTETGETEDTAEPEATTPPEPETTGTSEQTPEPNTTPPPKPISVYDYFETKLADEDRNLWDLVNQYVPGNSKDEKKILFLSLIRSGLVNEEHVDSQRNFIKYDSLKSKLEAIYPQNQGSQNGNPPPNGDGLPQTRKNAIQTITAALNLEPAVKESELNSEFHGWNEKISNLNKEEIINDFAKKMLSAIGGKRREKQTSQKVNDNVNDMKNKTGEELNEKIKENDEAVDTKAYEEKKEEIKTQKKRSALEDPDKYRRNVAIPGIKDSMAKNDIKENELDDDAKKDWEKIKNGEIQGEEIVEKEIKIKQSIGQQGVEKKVKFFENEVEKALKSGKKERIEKLKMQMIEFINSDNIFYESKKAEVQSLITRLDSGGNNQHPNQNQFPTGWVVGGGALMVVGLVVALIIRNKKKRKKYLAR